MQLVNGFGPEQKTPTVFLNRGEMRKTEMSLNGNFPLTFREARSSF